MKIICGALKASHFGPTLLVTTISFFLAERFGFGRASWGVAATVFVGQLLVGWTNDLFDFDDDLKHERWQKPLVSGIISRRNLLILSWVAVPINLGVLIFGPLGYRGGTIALLGVVVAMSYNFFFKFTLLSPLPYAICFAALPFAIATGAEKPIHISGIMAGAFLGVAAHFLNVLKDMDEDRESGINGAPQVLGSSRSRILAMTFAAAGVFSVYIFLSHG